MIYRWLLLLIVATLSSSVDDQTYVNNPLFNPETIDCWVDGYTEEVCCIDPPHGNPECWIGPYNWEVCCGYTGQKLELTCALEDFQSFKKSSHNWYFHGKGSQRFYMQFVQYVANFDYVVDVCAPAALIAYMLHMEENYWMMSRYWDVMFGRYVQFFQSAMMSERLLPMHYRNGWPLENGLDKLLGLRNQSRNNFVDIVLCYCNEDLSWLVSLKGELNPLNPTPVGPGIGGLDYPKMLRKNVNLRIYHKCIPDTQEGREAERERLSLDWAYMFREVTVRYVWDEIRADDCSAYTAYLYDEYEKLPDYSVFLHADASEHIPSIHYLSKIIHGLASGAVLLDFLHLGSNYVGGDDPSAREYSIDAQVSFERHWKGIFRSSFAPDHRTVASYCCVQFLVSRKRMKLRTREFYENALHYYQTKDSYVDLFYPVNHFYIIDVLSRDPCQRGMYLWHVIFGEDLIYPRRQNDVRLPLFLRTSNVEREYFVDTAWETY